MNRCGLVVAAWLAGCSGGDGAEGTAATTSGSPEASSSGGPMMVTGTSTTGGGADVTPTSGDTTGTIDTTSGVTSTGAASEASTADGSTGEAPLPVVETLRITDQNRHYVEMHGGWGPHLRGLMRAEDDALWFTADKGEDVLHNREILYFRRGAGDAAWTDVGALAHADGIQQNAASILIDGVIYTYAVNIAAHLLEECHLVVATPDVRACNTVLISGTPYMTPPSSNYVGAAVLGEGARVVWWTVVGENGAPGAFYYTYNYGGGWNGPVATDLTPYNDIGYVHAMATSDGRLMLVGQTFTGKYPDGTYNAVVAEVVPGASPTFVPLAGGGPEVQALSSGDLWLDADAGDVHVLATTSAGGVAYYHRPAGAPWAAHVQPLHVFADTYRARFMRAADGPLHVVRGSGGGGGVSVLRGPATAPGEAVDWAAAQTIAVTSPGAGFAAPSGLYVESPAYQSRPVGALQFAMCGQYEVSDGEVWQGELVAP
jgi:hypothetical protein